MVPQFWLAYSLLPLPFGAWNKNPFFILLSLLGIQWMQGMVKVKENASPAEHVLWTLSTAEASLPLYKLSSLDFFSPKRRIEYHRAEFLLLADCL